MKLNNTWTLDEALPLIRDLNFKVKEAGYYVALGGGVLNYGHSDKDLDLYFLKLREDFSLNKLVIILTDSFGNLIDLADYFEVLVWTKQFMSADPKRIDFFIQ